MIRLRSSLPRNRQFYSLIGGNLVVLALVGVFVLRPAFAALTKHTTEITSTKAEILGLQKKTENLKQLTQTYPIYESQYAPLIQSLPKTRDTAGYLTQLEDLAKLTSNQLLTTDAGGAQPGGGAQGTQKPAAPQTQMGGFPTIPLKIDIVGTYASVQDFIQRLETMDRFTRVDALELRLADTSGAVKATLEIQTLYLSGGAT